LWDQQWEQIQSCLPSSDGRRGRPFQNSRQIVEGIIYRCCTGIPWQDLPREGFGPWQTAWERHRRYAAYGTWDHVLQELLATADAAGKISWDVSVDATITRAHQHASNTTRPAQDTGAGVNHRPCGEDFAPSPLGGRREPAGHGAGRSREGLTTTIHAVVDGNGRSLAAPVTGGQRNDGAMLIEVLTEIRAPRPGRGRPRTRPDKGLTDRANTSRSNRRLLARRGITGVVPRKRDEIASRQRKGSQRWRPPGFDAVAYKGRNVAAHTFALAK